jgi:two-component system, NtrC family, sensor kinase
MRGRGKSYNIPLFWKFAIASIVVVVIFGAINIYLLWSSVYRSFEKEIDKRCKVLATIVSEKVVTPLVYDDHLSLYNILNEIKESDPSISYVFILNNATEIIAQTYDINIPPGLLQANTLSDGNYNIEVIETNNFQYPVIRDIAYPILNGEIGMVRLGIVEEHINQEINDAAEILILMILAFLVFGLLGSLFFSYIITKPIKEISEKAQVFDLDYLDVEDFNIDDRKLKQLMNIQFNDELDVLVVKFSEMLIRLKNSYIELKATQGALIQAEKLTSLGTLSAGVAHEINNPISGIKNCLNRIIRDPQNEEQNANYAILIKSAINKIENVVQHLLNFSRKQDITLEKTNLNSVIESALKLSSYKLQTNKINVNANNTNDCYVNASANHLEQVFVNLILNGLDAIIERKEKEPDLNGEIEIRLEENQKTVSIHIIDNGAGIPAELDNKIFDPFFTSKRVGEGTGLGLSVSFNVIKKHNGRIYFERSQDKGTDFIIELACLPK